jgi:hypothetical protein
MDEASSFIYPIYPLLSVSQAVDKAIVKKKELKQSGPY